MDNANLKPSQDARYLLSALIEIYRGNIVPLPLFDPVMEKNLLRDVFSSAIRFANFDESRHTISQEIAACALEQQTVQQQLELARSQTPDVLNAKMLAAAHVLELEEANKLRLM